MYKCIVVPSATYAQKGVQVLQAAQIYAFSRKNPGLSRHGCAWCVTVFAEELPRVLPLFAQNGVRTTGEIYDV